MTADGLIELDLIVIGGGPAGIVGATTASSFGKRVALVDDHRELGGAGANTGTVPSKTLRETALAFSGIRSRALYGVDLSLRREATVADFLRHERSVKSGLNHTLAQRLAESDTEVYFGTAEFEDPHVLRVNLKSEGELKQVRLRGEHILIATGSSPARPPEFPFDKPEVYDSDTILNLDRLPKSMAVVGAGVIGSEYACTFAELGTKVHVMDGRDVLLPFLDSEVSRALSGAMGRRGIVFHWNEEVLGCDSCAPGGITLNLKSGDRLGVDAVLVAAGRTSNTEALNLGAAGVNVGNRGLIPVDEHYQTNVSHISAVGDVIGFPAMASTSAQQARLAMRRIFGNDQALHPPEFLPTGVYTIPEVSMAGKTEDALRQEGVDYVAGVASYGSCARGRIIGDSCGFLKLLFHRRDLKLLGVHVIGEQATEVVHVGMMVLLTGGRAGIFDDACFNIPTLGALYKTAAREAALAAGKLNSADIY